MSYTTRVTKEPRHHPLFRHSISGASPSSLAPLLKRHGEYLEKQERDVLEKWLGVDGGVPTMARTTKELGITVNEACAIAISGAEKIRHRDSLRKLYKKRERAIKRLEEIELEIALLEDS